MNAIVQLILAAAATVASMIAAVDARAELISVAAQQDASGLGWHLQALDRGAPVVNATVVGTTPVVTSSIWDLDGAGLPAAIIAPREVVNPPASFSWAEAESACYGDAFGSTSVASVIDEEPNLELLSAHLAPEPPAIVMAGVAISAGAMWVRSRRRRTAV